MGARADEGAGQRANSGTHEDAGTGAADGAPAAPSPPGLRPLLARPDWRRDVAHLAAGSILGTVLSIAFFQVALQRTDEDLEDYRRVRNFISSTYVRPISEGDMVDRALHGLVEGLDPYSRYYDREQIAGVERDTSGVYQGIGVVFAPLAPPGQVLFPVEGSPAHEAGIEVGERIVRAGGLEVAEISREELLRVIGEAGEDGLPLAVEDRTGAVRELTLQPRELVDPSVRHARLLAPADGPPGHDLRQPIGYLAVTSFSRRTPEEFDAAVDGLLERAGGELAGLVVDVRGNPGGVLEAAVELANRFVAEGALVTHEGRRETVDYRARPELARLGGLPLAVLVDGGSASASEVFAAAVQEHRAGVVVGSPTYGKGVVQEVRRFADRMIVKLTTAYYYTPSRRNLERTVDRAWDCGIQPDLEVALSGGEARALTQHLASYTPPPEALEALRAWEAELGTPLVPGHPVDPQLDGALALFAGERPGAWRVAAVERAEPAGAPR